MRKRTSNQILASLIFLLVLFGLWYLLYRSSPKTAQAPTEEIRQTNTTATASSSASSLPLATTSPKSNLAEGQSQATYSDGEGQPDGSSIAVVEIDFDGKQFTPNKVDIHVNDWVFFKNNSTVNFWPASGPHPTHTEYPGFDAKKPIPPGSEYKFQFTKIGSWSFHDHLDESVQGVVNVVQ